MTETYEQLRDSATGEAGEAWKAADREESSLRALYEELKTDPRYTDEHKGEQAWGKYEASKEKIAAGRAKARELLASLAGSAERLSLPFPDGEGPITTDTNKLIASQNETSRVIRKLDRLLGSSKGPFKPDTLEVLRQEYGRGLETGGVQGGIICRGVLGASDELGIDKHSIVEGFRSARHRESYARAEHSERLVQLIGGSAPEPPFARPGRVRGNVSRNGSGALFMPRQQAATGPGRTRHWR